MKEEEHPQGFRAGNVVRIRSPANFKGEKIAAVLYKQRSCPDGVPVRILKDSEPVPYLCIRTELGDSIERV